jgi:hypothetical protein
MRRSKKVIAHSRAPLSGSSFSDRAVIHHRGRSRSRCNLKQVLFIIFLIIALLYKIAIDRILSHADTRVDTNDDGSEVRKTDMKRRKNSDINDMVIVAKDKGYDTNKKQGAVAIIASVPDNKERLLALWSQLECFYANDKYNEIIVSTPAWAKEENIIEPFLRNAVSRIPHLNSTSVILQYHLNDRYDVGLWCDALDSSTVNDQPAPVKAKYNEFVLSNDSIMAVEEHFTGILDELRQRNLTMSSLNFSFLDGFWLESTLRGFSKKGINSYTNQACVPMSHERWCPGLNITNKTEADLKKRCIVDNFEIGIASLFPRHEIYGLFPSDVPDDMIKDEFLLDGKTW